MDCPLCLVHPEGLTHLTPESEVLNFSFEVSNVGDLWSIFTVAKERKKQWENYNALLL